MNGRKKPSRKEPEPGFLRNSVVGIIGLGLMGGSLGMALNERCDHRLGMDASPDAERSALDLQAVDMIALDLEELVAESDIIILATPPRTNLEIIRQIAAFDPPPKNPLRVILDIGSTKHNALQAMDALVDTGHFDCIGGHPMCGKEVSGVAHAEASLFLGAPFAFCPLLSSGAHALMVAKELARAIGAKPLVITAEQHDSQVAYTSHLPFLTSAALVLNAANRFPKKLNQLLAGSGFYDTTRLAGSDRRMMMDILATNRQHILQAVDDLILVLTSLKAQLLNGDEAGLQETLGMAATYRQVIFPPNSRKSEDK